MIVGIENFIYCEGDDNHRAYYDGLAIALWRRGVSGVHIVVLTGEPYCVPVPLHVFDKVDAAYNAQEAMDRTVGDILHESDAKYDSTDWFRAAGAKFTRQDQIEVALGILIKN